MEDINSLIKKLRKEKNMSLSQFGDSIGGVSKSYLSMLENDERPITDSIMDKIIQNLSVNKKWLVYGDGEIYDEEKAALKAMYKELLNAARRYLQDCNHFKNLLIFKAAEEMNLKGNGLTIYDCFPCLTLRKFYDSKISPQTLVYILIDLYKSIEKTQFFNPCGFDSPTLASKIKNKRSDKKSHQNMTKTLTFPYVCGTMQAL